MTTQQALIAETVAGLKRALKRKSYGSDSDSEIHCPTNRGQKDKKRARFTCLGRLAPRSGLENETVEHAGSRREIVSRRPALIDEDGYDIETDEEDDDDERIREAVAAANEFYPYANVHLEQILAPLAAATELPTHPTLSRPFTSTMLTQLAAQGSAIMRKESQALWKTKHLMTRLCGDLDWAPCGDMTDAGAGRADPYADEFLSTVLRRPPEIEAGVPQPTSGSGAANGAHDQQDGHQGGDAISAETKPRANGESGGAREGRRRQSGLVGESDNKRRQKEEEAVNGAGDGDEDEDPSGMIDIDPREKGKGAAATVNGEPGAPPRPRPARGDNPGGYGRPGHVPSPPSGLDGLLVHPLFRNPAGARPSRDIGLPEQEAEDLRRLLGLWVQKQEEVCRGVRRLNDGLLKADRLRQDVLEWAKAEAHCGPNRDMSDGEDWYDREKWGLAEDLKKGEDGEEEEAAAAGTTTGKKTRARR